MADDRRNELDELDAEVEKLEGETTPAECQSCRQEFPFRECRLFRARLGLSSPWAYMFLCEACWAAMWEKGCGAELREGLAHLVPKFEAVLCAALDDPRLTQQERDDAAWRLVTWKLERRGGEPGIG